MSTLYSNGLIFAPGNGLWFFFLFFFLQITKVPMIKTSRSTTYVQINAKFSVNVTKHGGWISG